MKKIIGLFNHIVIVLALALTGCGYTSDKPVQNIDVYKTDELQTCKIDVSKLSEIFTTNQADQIKCLQENFIQFTKYVRAKHPGSVSQDELGVFVKKFFQDQSDAIINGLSLIFQLNMILLKDEADRISHSNITPLFELLIKVNQEAVVLTNIMKMMDDPKNQSRFWELRKLFNESTERFATSAVGVIEKCPGLNQKLNMREFILDMSKRIGDGQIDEDTVDSFIFFKRLIVGGDTQVVTSDELKTIISRAPKILGLVFDVYYIKGSNFENPNDEIKFYVNATRDVYHQIRFDQPDFELISSKQMVKLAQRFFKDYDVEAFKPSIEALKERFIGGKKDSISLKDLDMSLRIVHDFFEKVYFNYVTYDDPLNAQLLNVKSKIAVFPYRQLKQYDLFSPERIEQLHNSFADTVVNFRYFRDSTGMALYDGAVSRNKEGLVEVNISKWLAWKLLKAYGHTNTKGQMQLSMEEFAKFLLDSKPLLQELKLWSPNFETFSRNAVLLGDLFQEQSDGDQEINVNEATEYIGMLLTAVHVSGQFTDELSLSCDPGINKEEPMYEKDCFNAGYFNIVLNKLGYKKSMPRLHTYISRTNQTEAQDYLKGVEGFARDDDRPGVPVNARDVTLVIGAMLNIESTFIRFDTNADNIIDYNELSIAYGTYKNSIIALAKLKPEQEKYAKGIFLYMASKMEIPKTGTWMTDAKFAAFNSCVQTDWCRNTFMDKVEAKRLNIGKLLYYMVSQATPSTAKK